MTGDRLARVLRTCEEALARGGAERLAYLDAACGADADLRHDVEVLLARRDDSCDGFLMTPPWRRPPPVLAAGQRLGPYEVTGALGAGGMGAVYRARDPRLERTVAIKVIAGDGEMDPGVRQRLTREARAIAAINHPNVCAIYDVGREVPSNGSGERRADGGDRGPSDPVDFLVIEYLEGLTLTERVAEAPLGLQELLQIGIDVADGLAAAHGRGIVHGDLKPANIMLSRSLAGPVAKLLDFGLAELRPPRPVAGGVQARREPGIAPARPRTMRGTLPYMAPEQLAGKQADTRTDLFAFGCVLYEMLTGRRAFTGDTEASLASAIMTSEPPTPSTLQPQIPASLDRLVMRCLAKDPADRWESARDIADRLRGIAGPGAAAAGLAASPSPLSRRLWVGAAVLALLGCLVAVGTWRFRSPAPPGPRTLVLTAPEGVALGSAQGVEFSSDGGAVVYSGTNNGIPALYWQNLSETDARLISGSESPGQPYSALFVSPDGAWLGFARAGKLTKVRIRTGQVAEASSVTVLDEGIGMARGVSWGDDGTILYCPNPYAGLWRVSAEGGPARELTHPDASRSEGAHCWPQVLPGGRVALFTIKHPSGRQDRGTIAVVALDSGRVTRLVEGGSYARYAPSGHLVYARNGSLLAVPFDLASLTVRGRPMAVLSGVSMDSAGNGSARFAISSTGALVYEPARPRPYTRKSLIWVDRDGQVEPATPDQRPYLETMSLSPDGRKLAVRIENAGLPDSQLWAYDLVDRRWQQLTSEGDNGVPLWSPTGDRVAFSSNRDGAFNLYVTPPNGDRRAERLTRSPHWQYACSWSPDGRLLVYQEQEEAFGWNLWILSVDGDHQPRRWGPQNVNAMAASFSPDGRWIAYQSQESGRAEVYVRPLSAPGREQRVSGPNGGSVPVWSRDGGAVLYLDGATVMAARVESLAPLRLSEPHLAFALPFVPFVRVPSSPRLFVPTPDGRRIILVRPDQETPPQAHRLLVIPHWVEGLRAKVPPDH